MNLLFLLLQDQSGGNPLIFFVLVFVFFGFFMIRPQIKKQKQERKFRDFNKKRRQGSYQWRNPWKSDGRF